MSPRNLYSSKDEAYIREWAGVKTWIEIAEALGRTPEAVMTWASKRGISGSFSHPRSSTKFGERVCQGPNCGELYQASRDWQKYCSERCSRSSRCYRLYGLTPEAWEELFESQGRACVCGKSESSRWHVDHDHSCCSGSGSCGKCVRGILCGQCNTALGMVDDNIDTLNALISYLSRSGR